MSASSNMSVIKVNERNRLIATVDVTASGCASHLPRLLPPFGFSSEGKRGSDSAVLATTYPLIQESPTTDPACIEDFPEGAQSGAIETSQPGSKLGGRL